MMITSHMTNFTLRLYYSSHRPLRIKPADDAGHVTVKSAAPRTNNCFILALFELQENKSPFFFYFFELWYNFRQGLDSGLRALYFLFYFLFYFWLRWSFSAEKVKEALCTERAEFLGGLQGNRMLSGGKTPKLTGCASPSVPSSRHAHRESASKKRITKLLTDGGKIGSENWIW